MAGSRQSKLPRECPRQIQYWGDWNKEIKRDKKRATASGAVVVAKFEHVHDDYTVNTHLNHHQTAGDARPLIQCFLFFSQCQSLFFFFHSCLFVSAWIHQSTTMASESCTVMLERESLQNLMRISDSPTLRDKVRTLQICTHYLSKDLVNHYFRQCKPISEHIDDDDTNSMSDVYNCNIPEDARYIDGMREAATIDSNNKGFYQRYLEQADFTSSLAVAYLIRAMTNSIQLR